MHRSAIRSIFSRLSWLSVRAKTLTPTDSLITPPRSDFHRFDVWPSLLMDANLLRSFDAERKFVLPDFQAHHSQRWRHVEYLNFGPRNQMVLLHEPQQSRIPFPAFRNVIELHLSSRRDTMQGSPFILLRPLQILARNGIPMRASRRITEQFGKPILYILGYGVFKAVSFLVGFDPIQAQ